MPRVIGIDPGTVSVDICGLENGEVFLDQSLPTRDALADPSALVRLLQDAGPLDLIAGPSGYGLPVTRARDATDADLRLAFLAAPREPGGIGGLRTLVRAFAESPLPVVLTPGVIHLPSVPDHRKVNHVDMGTADKVAAVALAIYYQRERRRCREQDVSLILLELGAAFTAAVAVQHGQIVDGLGGSSGAMGMHAPGALDGEVAFLAGTISKDLLFTGGADVVSEMRDASAETLLAARTPRARLAWEAYIESAAKAVSAIALSVPTGSDLILSGRFARVPEVRASLASRLGWVLGTASIHVLTGFATTARQAAQGAALIADGLAGGASKPLVDTLRIRDARGTCLDHLYVISPEAARRRLGL